MGGDGFLGFGDLLVDAAQAPAGPAVLVLVVDDLVAALVGGAGRVSPRGPCGEICAPVARCFTRVGETAGDY
jgi:hypothetical protein